MTGTTRYLSPSGSDSNDGLSWATAKATLAGIDSVDTINDTICVDSSGTYGAGLSAQSFASAGTSSGGPTKIISCDASIATPTAKKGAAFNQSGLSISGSGVYLEGLTFNNGAILGFGGGYLKLKNCTLNLQSSTQSTPFQIGNINTRTGHTELENVDIHLNPSSAASLSLSGGVFIMRGGSISGSNAYSLISLVASGGLIYLDGVDLSGIGASVTNIVGAYSYTNRAVLRNCKLPASWSGNVSGLDSIAMGCEIEAFETDASGYPAAYRRFSLTYFGVANSTTAIYRQGGASNGANGFSWKATTQSVFENLLPFRLPETALFNSTVGSPITLAMEVLCSTAPTNSQLWMEAVYPTDANSPLDALASSAPTSFLDAKVVLTDSAAVWTNAPANYVAKKISMTVTPSRAGFILPRLALAANMTVYADPLVQVS